ncbi:hypothetical protein BC962_3236 [Gillisia mitskevichiae]|uniref:Tetratricopeptide repeat protein n=1 Tax=Gillisia mitskevichiae TaxID=270921 RepID=A0A495P1N0_9FLAO|nr:hypothetical protein [Gillisia mitskevichiae]RKS42569.1 hypothetical protein BC962_3236 [Gillisia mitskevichiae]
MSKNDWYINSIWNEQIETEFEIRLKKSRSNFHKAQYLRTQAYCLLNSDIKSFQEKGIQLMNRLFEDYPNEKFNVIQGNEMLGDYYLRMKSFDNAEKHFRIVTEYYYSETRSGTTGLADLKLSETLLKSKKSDKFQEAYLLATDKFEKTGGELNMNSDKFYYAELMANLCNIMNRKEEASQYAKDALELSKISAPEFTRHKTVGLIKASIEQIENLNEIVKKNNR